MFRLLLGYSYWCWQLCYQFSVRLCKEVFTSGWLWRWFSEIVWPSATNKLLVNIFRSSNRSPYRIQCNSSSNRSPCRIQCNSSSNRSPYRIQCNSSSNRSPCRIVAPTGLPHSLHSLVSSLNEHNGWIVNVHIQEGINGHIISSRCVHYTRL